MDNASSLTKRVQRALAGIPVMYRTEPAIVSLRIITQILASIELYERINYNEIFSLRNTTYF